MRQLRSKLRSYLLLACGALALSACAAVDLGRQAWDGARQGKASLPLEASEEELLERVFGAGLDRRPIRLVYDSVAGAETTKTLGNEIHFSAGNDPGDSSFRRSQRFTALLVHESTHVWQYQRVGYLYAADSLFAQAKGYLNQGDRNKAYWYQVDGQASYNAEQQAKMIEDYVAYRLYGRKPQKCQDCARLPRERYCELVEERIRREVNPAFQWE